MKITNNFISLLFLAQNVQKKVRDLHLKTAYENDCTINEHVRMLVALAFVPPEDVFAAFETLEEHVDASLDELMTYFEEYSIGKKLKRRRKAPLFHLDWWNVYHRTLRTEPKTKAFVGFRLNSTVLILHCGDLLKDFGVSI